MLAAVVAVMLWAFVAFHIYLITIGYSTSEWSKKGQTEQILMKKESFFSKWANIKRKNDNYELPTETLNLFEEEAGQTLAEIEEKKEKMTKLLEKLQRGSIWRSSSLMNALLVIFFPDRYYN